MQNDEEDVIPEDSPFAGAQFSPSEAEDEDEDIPEDSPFAGATFADTDSGIDSDADQLVDESRHSPVPTPDSDDTAAPDTSASSARESQDGDGDPGVAGSSEEGSATPGHFIDDAIYGRGVGDQVYRDATGQTGMRSRPGVENPYEDTVATTPEPEPEKAAMGPDEKGIWDTDQGGFYQGLTEEEGRRKWASFLEDDNTSAAADGLAIYTHPETGENIAVAPPSTDRRFTELLRHRGDGFLGRVERGLTPMSKTSAMEYLKLGLRESSNDFMELAAAMHDSLIDVQGFDDSLKISDKVENVTASADTDSTITGTLIADGAPAVIGGVGVAGVTAKALKGAPLLLKALGVATSGEAAATATVGTDEAPIFANLDFGDEDFEKVIAQRANVFAESLVLSGVLGTGTMVAREGIRTAYDFMFDPLVTAMRSGDQAIESNAIKQVMKIAGKLPRDATPQQMYEASRAMAQVLEDNRQEVVNSIAKLGERREINFDTATALIRGTDDPAQIAAISGLRAGQLGKGAENTTAAVAGPMRILEEELQGQAARVGGDTVEEQTDTIFRGADNLVDAGRDDLTVARLDLSTAEAQFEAAEKNIEQAFRSDAKLGFKLDRLAKLNGTEIGDLRRQSLDGMKANLRKGLETLRNKKNELYARVSGGAVDHVGLYNLLDDLPDETITKATEDLRKSRPLRNLLRGAREAKAPVEDINAAGEPILRAPTLDEQQDRFADFLDENGVDFGTLFRNIRPELSRAASDLYARSGGGREAGRNLRDVISFIDNDSIDFLRQNGDAAIAADAEAAHQFFAKEWGPIFGEKSGFLRDYAEAYDATVARTSQSARTAAASNGTTLTEFGAGEFSQRTQDLINPAFASGDAARLENFRNALEQTGPKGSGDQVADYLVTDVFDDFARQYQEGGIKSINAFDIEARLKPYYEVLSKSFPKQAKQINQFIGEIKEAQRLGRDVDGMLKITADRMKQVREDIQASVLNDFLDTTVSRQGTDFLNDGLTTTRQPYKAFERLMTGDGALDKLARIDEELAGLDPAKQQIVRDGMIVAYNRLLTSKLLSKTSTTSGAKAISIAKSSDAANEVNSLFEVGRVIFKDEPETMQAIEAVVKAANMVEQGAGAKPNRAFSSTAPLQAAQTATNRLIYATVGALSRAGTKMRALVGAGLEHMAPSERAAAIMDNIMADPKYARDLMLKYNKKPNDPELEGRLVQFLYSGYLKTETDDDTGPDGQMRRLLGVE